MLLNFSNASPLLFKFFAHPFCNITGKDFSRVNSVTNAEATESGLL
jgi:hypothetical protein